MPGTVLPSLEVAAAGFRLMGCRPEELTRALGQAVFDRIAGDEADAVSGLFGRAALERYAALTGLAVEPSHVQNVVDKLVDANLIARAGQGAFRVVDPFVRQYWRGRKALMPG